MRPISSALTGDQLRAWRRARSFTQVEFADALGCSLRAVQYYEAGERRIPLSIQRILDLLDRHRPTRS